MCVCVCSVSQHLPVVANNSGLLSWLRHIRDTLVKENIVKPPGDLFPLLSIQTSFTKREHVISLPWNACYILSLCDLLQCLC